MERRSGILLPMSSLPSNYGIGTMGKSAYEFIDFLKEAGQSYWQLLPMGPTSYGDSPYASFSSFAGNPYFIDLDMLIEDGLISDADVKDAWWSDAPEKVNYGAIYYYRYPVLRKAFAAGKDRFRKETEEFRKENASWLENYALFMAVKNHFEGAGWTAWKDTDIKLHRPEAVRAYGEKLKDDVDFWVFIQFLFFRQWKALREYAHKNGIQFIGDVPIYVALDSADVWSEPKYFQLDENNVPKKVSGCPPDAFTADGQLWGNPLYDWDVMKRDGYGWWIRRIEGAKKLFDVIRVDHFRGFDSYWAVPYGDKTAKNGKWEQGPGFDFVGMLKSWFYDTRFIAEDLGFLTPSVSKLLKDSGFPGMKVLEFGFGVDVDSGYLPHDCVPNSVCYVGTHDNDTVSGWLKNSPKKEVAYAREYMHITPKEGWAWGFIRSGMATASELFVAQMQDILELGPETRVNLPGSVGVNWTWRMLPGVLTAELAEKLYSYTRTYRRTAKKAADKVETPEKETETAVKSEVK